MPDKIKSLQGRLYNLSKERNRPFQLILNQFGAEQFLERLSLSTYAKKFIFKGGMLLSYLIETDRKTKDLDFSIKELGNQVDEILKVIQQILEVPVDDGLTWDKLEGRPLNHPEMDYPGARIKCPFRLGNMKGFVRMDLALGDVVEAAFIPLQKLKYRGAPLAGKEFKILSYPSETIFSEKYQIAVFRGANNTRMKDFYDLHKLCETSSLNSRKLKKSLENTFKKRETPVVTELRWVPGDLEKLQMFWTAYLKKEELENAPKKIDEIIAVINAKLKEVFS